VGDGAGVGAEDVAGLTEADGVAGCALADGEGGALDVGAAVFAGAALAVGAGVATGRGAGGRQSRGWTMVSPVVASWRMTRTPDSSAHAARLAASVGRSVTP
jgi:hypothetical protein